MRQAVHAIGVLLAVAAGLLIAGCAAYQAAPIAPAETAAAPRRSFAPIASCADRQPHPTSWSSMSAPPIADFRSFGRLPGCWWLTGVSPARVKKAKYPLSRKIAPCFSPGKNVNAWRIGRFLTP